VLKINITELENPFYKIKGSLNKNNEICYFDYNQNYQNNLSTLNEIQHNVFKKTINWKHMIIPEKYFSKEKLIDNINTEFIHIIKNLGDKHRKNSDPERLNLNLNKIKDLKPFLLDDTILSRKFIAKCNIISDVIAYEGRIGPSNYILMNYGTYQYLEMYLKISQHSGYKTKNKHNNFVLNFSNLGIYIFSEISDDVIVFGRKNSMDQTGVFLLIKTDEENNIDYYIDYQKNININYNIVEIGMNPELHFFTAEFEKLLVHSRKLKLEKLLKSKFI